MARPSRTSIAGVLLAVCVARTAVAATPPPMPPPSATDRVLVVSPHPDDESLCCAGYLQRALAAGAKVGIVWVTAGDAFEVDAFVTERHLRLKGKGMERLGHRRIGEAIAAAERLGVPLERLEVLGYPDRGVTALMSAYYDLPYFSPWTRSDRIPYARVRSPGVLHEGKNLERDLRAVFAEFDPTLVLAAAPEDQHGDHSASGALALKLLTERGQQERLRYWLVHAGHPWPHPRGLHPDLEQTPPPNALKRQWQPFELTAAERDAKLAALELHRSQWDVMAHFMKAFVRRTELYAR